MEFDLDNRTFRVIQNDGPGAEVDEDTVFYFRQQEDVVQAEYFGGGVRLGTLVGILERNSVRHCYSQVNQAGELQIGRAQAELRPSTEGRLQMVNQWEWEDSAIHGLCVLEEFRDQRHDS